MILSGLGRLGRDAEVRKTPDGTAVANLALAYNYGKKDNDGKRPTTWVDASLWGERAEKLAEYLKKGTQICVVLEDVHIATFKRADGTEGFSMKARVSSLEFSGSRPDSKPAEEKPRPEPRPAAKVTGTKFDDFEDDIPF